LAPVGTPEDIARRWNAAVNKTLADATVNKWLGEQGYSARPMGIKEFSAYVARDVERWTKVSANIKQ